VEGPPHTRADTVLLSLLYGAVAPTVTFLAGWWLSYAIPGANIAAGALIGLAVGLLWDVAFLPRLLRRGYDLPGPVLVGLFGFYSVMVFGMFMGVPVPQLALGAAAGVFAARAGRDVRATRRMAVGCLAPLCVASAIFALGSPSTGDDLEGMLGLPFEVTTPMVIALIVVGGILLLAGQYWVTGLAGRLAGRGAGAVPRNESPA
jgi:hypothetical protein